MAGWDAVKEILERFHGEHASIEAKLDQILANQAEQKELLMSVQDDVNAADTAVVAATAAMNAAVAVLQSGGENVSTTQLDTDVTSLQTATSALTAATQAAGTTTPAAPAPQGF
jgi:hypothetical protein